MLGFVRTVFFIVVVYYLIRFISRVLLPYFRAVTEINERQKQEEKPYITQPGRAPKKAGSPDGEYVDYTEVK